MPRGNVLAFQLTADHLHDVLTSADRSAIGDDPHPRRLVDAVQRRVGDALRAAHLNLIRGEFDPGAIAGSHMISAATREGPRQFYPLRVDGFGDDDPYEVLGIALTSSYRPTWLDWRSADGAPHVLRIDSDLQRMVNIARPALARVIPAVEDAPLVVIPHGH